MHTFRWQRAAALLTIGAALAGCGGGGGDSDPEVSPPPQPPFAWFDQSRIQAFGSADTVELGFDGAASYVRQDGYVHTRPGVFATSLAYIGDSGAPTAGQTTQWLRFAMRGDGYFATQGQHLPIGLNFAQYPDPRVARSSPVGVESRIVFLGRDNVASWGCLNPSSVNAYFETRISGRIDQPDISAVQCAQDAPDLRDGIWYQVEISAGPQGIAYAIAGEDGRILFEVAMGDLDYPASDWNLPFLQQMADPGAPFPAYYAAMTQNREFSFLASFTTDRSPWSLTFAGIDSGWR
jgi:hypothetical protein